MSIRVLIVTEHQVPNPEAIAEILEAMNPPALPHFAGAARVVVGTDADDTIRFLDEGD